LRRQHFEGGNAIGECLWIGDLRCPCVKEHASQSQAESEDEPAVVEEFHSHEKAQDDTKKDAEAEKSFTADDADGAELFKPRKSALPPAICFMRIISGSSPSLCIVVPLCG